MEGIEVHQTLRITNLWMVIMSSASCVIDVGQPNRPFQEILLWRGGEPKPLLHNYVRQPGEQLTIEKSIPVPIDLQPAAQQWDVPSFPPGNQPDQSGVEGERPV